MVAKKESEWDRYKKQQREQAINFPKTKMGKAFSEQLKKGRGSF